MSSIIELVSLISLNGFLTFEFFPNTKKIYEYTSFDKKYNTLDYVDSNRSIIHTIPYFCRDFISTPATLSVFVHREVNIIIFTRWVRSYG